VDVDVEEKGRGCNVEEGKGRGGCRGRGKQGRKGIATEEEGGKTEGRRREG
jgi:hypothetical protein